MLAAAAYGALAALSLALMREAHGVATIWPSSGVVLAALLLLPRRAHTMVLAGVALASVGANLAFGSTVQTAILFTLANLVEAAVAARVACSGCRPCGSFDDPLHVGRFVVGVGAGAFASALIATLATGQSCQFFSSWLMTVLLGMLIVTPVIVTTVTRSQRAQPEARRWPVKRLAAVLAGTAGVAGAVFGQDTYPLLFLPLAVVVFATYVLGPLGAGSSVLVIAIIGSALTGQGHGPAVIEGDRFAHVLFFQAYLLVLLASSLPLAALLANSRRAFAQLTVSHRLLEAAERGAKFGHWRLDLRTRTLIWSAEVFSIHGLARGAKLDLDRALDAYHPDDRAAVSAALERAMMSGESFNYEARIIRSGSDIRYVRSVGMAETDRGEIVGLFGVFMDITESALAMRALESAREQAEQEAAAARQLAETDQLTGLASRRKTLAVLDRHLVAAADRGLPLAVVLLDVDHFKAINDRFGHGVGDAVLRGLAMLTRKCVRDGGLVGRLGGEEFLIVLPGADRNQAQMVAEQVRRAIAGAQWPGGPERVTVSLGVANHVAGDDGAGMLRAADLVLYEAKHAGRNRLRIAA